MLSAPSGRIAVLAVIFGNVPANSCAIIGMFLFNCPEPLTCNSTRQHTEQQTKQTAWMCPISSVLKTLWIREEVLADHLGSTTSLRNDVSIAAIRAWYCRASSSRVFSFVCQSPRDSPPPSCAFCEPDCACRALPAVEPDPATCCLLICNNSALRDAISSLRIDTSSTFAIDDLTGDTGDRSGTAAVPVSGSAPRCRWR